MTSLKSLSSQAAVVSDRENTEKPGISQTGGGAVVPSSEPLGPLESPLVLAGSVPPVPPVGPVGPVVPEVVSVVAVVVVVVPVTVVCVLVVLVSVDTGVLVPESPHDVVPSPNAKAIKGYPSEERRFIVKALPVSL
jgi:hypothetical protein